MTRKSSKSSISMPDLDLALKTGRPAETSRPKCVRRKTLSSPPTLPSSSQGRAASGTTLGVELSPAVTYPSKLSLQLRPAVAHAAAAVCLASRLAVWIASTASFSRVPRLLLDPPSKVPLQLPAWHLGLWHGCSSCLPGVAACCASPARSPMLCASPARSPIFLVFRDCCLTPLKSSAAASCMASGSLARHLCCNQLFFWRSRWLCPSPACRLGLWHPA